VKYLVQKRKELFSGKDYSFLFLVITTCIMMYFLVNSPESELVILEEEYLPNEVSSIKIYPENPMKTPEISVEEYINRFISTLNRKCSSTVTTNSKIIYYIKWDNIDEIWKMNSTAIKEELNNLSSSIEGIWKSHGVNKTVELVLDSQLYDKALAVSTNGKITFSTH